MKWVVLVLPSFLLVTAVHAASFDCAKASTKIEHIICDSPEISKLDERVAASYKALLQDITQANEIRQSQKHWIWMRDNCPDVGCVKREYELRLKVLDANRLKAGDIPPGMIGYKHASYIIEGEGKEQPLCKAILAELNKRRVTDFYRPCLSEEILKLPGMQDPAWERLDLAQHEELAKKIYTLNSVGTAEYFRKVKVMPRMYPSPAQQQRSLEGLKKLDAEMYMLRLPPELYGEKRVLVTIRHKNEMCGMPLQMDPIRYRGEGQESAWVNPDMKEIAPGPDGPGNGYDSRAARPLMYRGQLYLVRPYGTGDELEIFRLKPEDWFMDTVCTIGLTIK